MKKNFFALLLVTVYFLISITGCSSQTVTTPTPPQLSQANDEKKFAAIREYEQENGLFNWTTAPRVT